MYVVYGLYENAENLIYIGITSKERLQTRYNEHKIKSKANKNKKNYKIDYKLRKIVRTGGHFTIKQLFEFETQEEVIAKEIELINFYGRKTRKGGILYNSTVGGEGIIGYIPTKKQRLRMGFAQKGNKNALGSKRPDLVERTVKAVNMFDLNGNLIKSYTSQKEASDDTGIQHSQISAGALYRHRCAFWYAKSISVIFRYVDDTSEIKVTFKPKIMRPVLQLDLNNQIVKEFKSACEARRLTGINNARILKCCNGIAKTAGKFKWKFKE